MKIYLKYALTPNSSSLSMAIVNNPAMFVCLRNKNIFLITPKLTFYTLWVGKFCLNKWPELTPSPGLSFSKLIYLVVSLIFLQPAYCTAKAKRRFRQSRIPHARRADTITEINLKFALSHIKLTLCSPPSRDERINEHNKKKINKTDNIIVDCILWPEVTFLIYFNYHYYLCRRLPPFISLSTCFLFWKFNLVVIRCAMPCHAFHVPLNSEGMYIHL